MASTPNASSDANQTWAMAELETLAEILLNQFTPNCNALFSLGKLPTALDCRLLIGRITARILDEVSGIICTSPQESLLRTKIRNSAYSLIDLLAKRAREAEEEDVVALRDDVREANGYWTDELQQKFELELKPQLILLNSFKQRVHNEILEPLRTVDKSLLTNDDLVRCIDIHAEAYQLVYGDNPEGIISNNELA